METHSTRYSAEVRERAVRLIDGHVAEREVLRQRRH